MSEYRDALVTAKERVARLEALAKERGLPRKSKRGLAIALGAGLVGIVSVLLFIGGRRWRQSFAPHEEVIVDRDQPSAPAPVPPHDLEWYEPFDSWNPIPGPQEAWTSDRTHLIVGLLWHRGERTNGLYLGAFDYDTLAKRWVVGPFESEWTGEEDERFHVGVSGDRAIMTDSAGSIRVFSVDTGALLGKKAMPRGTLGLCPTVRGPAKWMVGFGAHDEANTAQALFPWELDHIKPYYFDPRSLSLTPAPNAPPEGTWCGSTDDCDPIRKDGCHDSEGRWQWGNRFVRIDGSSNEQTISGWTRDTKGVATQRWTAPMPAGREAHGTAMSDKFFFQGYFEHGRVDITAIDLDTGKSHLMDRVDKTSAARLRLLKWTSPDRLFVLYDDEMFAFKASGERVGKITATP